MLSGDVLPEGSTDLVALLCVSSLLLDPRSSLHIHIGRFGGEPVVTIVSNSVVEMNHWSGQEGHRTRRDLLTRSVA